MHFKSIFLKLNQFNEISTLLIYQFFTLLGILRGQKSENLIINISKWGNILKCNTAKMMLKTMRLTICNHNFFYIRYLKWVTGPASNQDISNTVYTFWTFVGQNVFEMTRAFYDNMKKWLVLQIRGPEGFKIFKK